MQLAVDELILHELLVVRVKICQQKSQGQASSNNRSEPIHFHKLSLAGPKQDIHHI